MPGARHPPLPLRTTESPHSVAAHAARAAPGPARDPYENTALATLGPDGLAIADYGDLQGMYPRWSGLRS